MNLLNFLGKSLFNNIVNFAYVVGSSISVIICYDDDKIIHYWSN